ncbi:MAG: hypothetical protein RLY97_2043, partial [Pseudomonadota bacterium]
LKQADDAPEMISAKVAECPKREGKRPAPPPSIIAAKTQLVAFNPRGRSGKSDDGTLAWNLSAELDGAHNLSVDWRQDGKMETLLIEEVAAPEKPKP